MILKRAKISKDAIALLMRGLRFYFLIFHCGLVSMESMKKIQSLSGFMPSLSHRHVKETFSSYSHFLFACSINLILVSLLIVG